jgi:hypothetical protein
VRLGFDSRQRQRIFPLTSVSRPALGPTQPPVQWVPGVLSRDKARPGRDADHSPHLVPRSRMSRSYRPTSSPPSAFRACSGTALPLVMHILIFRLLLDSRREEQLFELHDCCCLCRWSETVSELRPTTGLLFIPHVHGEP